MIHTRQVTGRLLAAVMAFPATLATAHATTTFFSQSGSSSLVNQSLSGQTVADHLGSGNYNGYIGQLILMPEDQSTLASMPSGTPGITEITNTGAFEGYRGLVGYCIDSETAFGVTTSSMSQIYTYAAQSYSEANQRYLDESVPYYLDGGLKRAAFLLETFYEQTHNSGAIAGAAMQAAIWEVLYDANPDVTLNADNYYIRTNSGSSSAQAAAAQVRDLANSFFAQADALDWGGPDYDPADRVVFWLDPTQVSSNQSIITLNPMISYPVQVPELGSSQLLMGGIGVLLLFRRRGAAR